MGFFSRIRQAEIVGTCMAENTGGSPNIRYSVLLYYDNGTVELKEGSANDIRPYLEYMSPRNSPVNEKQLKSALKEFGDRLFIVLRDMGQRYGL